MKIIAIFILFVTIVSNNSFGQDYYVKSTSFAYTMMNLNEHTYTLDAKYNVETNIHFTKDKITMDDVFKTTLDVILRDTSEEKGIKYDYYLCKNNVGDTCIFLYEDSTARTNSAYVIIYDNVRYFYYTKL